MQMGKANGNSDFLRHSAGFFAALRLGVRLLWGARNGWANGQRMLAGPFELVTTAKRERTRVNSEAHKMVPDFGALNEIGREVECFLADLASPGAPG
jgi:hypothetical protein